MPPGWSIYGPLPTDRTVDSPQAVRWTVCATPLYKPIGSVDSGHLLSEMRGYMARQHSCGTIAVRRLPPKLVWIRDEFHPYGAWSDETPAPGRSYTRNTWPPRGRGRGESLTSPRRIEAKQRAVEAMRLYYRDRLTWQVIAARLGFKDRSGPWRAVRRLVDRYNA